MTTAPALANEHPPFIAAPDDAAPVIVIVELAAKDSAVLEQHLTRADVIPTTRLASGINYSWTVRDQNNPARFLLIQQWNSVKQQQEYIAWRSERGDLAELRTLITEEPMVRYFTPIDMLALPSQVHKH